MRNRLVVEIFGASTALACSAAFAAVSDTSVMLCSAMKDDIQRLACFDKIADEAGLVGKTAPTKIEGSGKWYTTTKTDPLTDKSIYTAILISESGKGRFGENISMVARCANGTTDLFVNWSSFIGTDDASVTYRVGKNKAITRSWQISTDHTSTFFPGSPVKTLKDMMQAETFAVNVTPYSESPVTAIFEVSGAESAFADIRKDCKW
ncbi:type VI secretion system-associated protein TagO [Pseudomonas graminis]|uniref:type VI secretion system-associated protein TagO n=1 Tax=Pseudomonas graminis TaxID=158627 RepID=UPI003C221301